MLMIFKKKLKKFITFLTTSLLSLFLIKNLINSISTDFTYKSFIYEVHSNTFNLNRDVLVFVHIQKTGGSNFDRYLIKNLLNKNNQSKWEQACTLKSVLIDKSQKKKKFTKFVCARKNLISGEPNWYFSRQTFGWICGLHPDYTELKRCVPRFYKNVKIENIKYFTILRDPVKRYISEWKHVSKGATWKRYKENRCFK